MQFEFKSVPCGPLTFLHARAVNEERVDCARTHAYVGHIDDVTFWGQGPARNPLTPIAWAVSHAMSIKNLRNKLPPVFFLRGKTAFEKYLLHHPLTNTTRYHPLEAWPTWKALRRSYQNGEFSIGSWGERSAWTDAEMAKIRDGLNALAATAPRPNRPISAMPIPTMRKHQVGWPTVWNDDS